jgi:hypothetical protein
MAEDKAQHDNLPAIEFESPGRFQVDNPQSPVASPCSIVPADFQLGVDDGVQRAGQMDELRSHALALMQQARHSLCLFTPDLEAWLYHHQSIQQACQELLLARPQNSMRILLRDSSPAVRQGHRLLALARRLPSSLQIRRLNPDYPAETSAYLLADDRGLLLRKDPTHLAGYALYNDPGRVRQCRQQFDQAWNTSVADPELRSFLL